MPVKRRTYDLVMFPESVIQAVIEEAGSLPDAPTSLSLATETFEVKRGNESTTHDSLEQFFRDLRLGADSYSVTIPIRSPWMKALPTPGFVEIAYGWTQSAVTIGHADTEVIGRFFDIFDRARDANRIPASQVDGPRIFLGHGGDPQWRELYMYLTTSLGFKVEEFGSQPRAGFTAKEVLESALLENNFAILVMTGEDVAEDELRARQNVVHEIGLFQGRYGFTRAIVVHEIGVEQFSNMAGVQDIRFPPTMIKAAFAEVADTIRREFISGEAGPQ